MSPCVRFVLSWLLLSFGLTFRRALDPATRYCLFAHSRAAAEPLARINLTARAAGPHLRWRPCLMRVS